MYRHNPYSLSSSKVIIVTVKESPKKEETTEDEDLELDDDGLSIATSRSSVSTLHIPYIYPRIQYSGPPSLRRRLLIPPINIYTVRELK